MEDCVIITNIQRFSLHDGPGIRTTIFLKGCSLRCPWCANPENINGVPERYHKDGRDGIYGRLISCDELFRELMKDRLFYGITSAESGAYAGMTGGVTFSGGEPLLQIERLEPLMKRLKENNVHLCVETALFVNERMLNIALQYIDLFYVDVKLLDATRCKEIVGGNLDQYQLNVTNLFATGKPVVFRIPVIGGFTDSTENRKAIFAWLKRYTPIKVELIKEHNLGESKYFSLGKKPLNLNSITDEMMKQYKEDIQTFLNVDVEICKA